MHVWYVYFRSSPNRFINFILNRVNEFTRSIASKVFGYVLAVRVAQVTFSSGCEDPENIAYHPSQVFVPELVCVHDADPLYADGLKQVLLYMLAVELEMEKTNAVNTIAALSCKLLLFIIIVLKFYCINVLFDVYY